MRRRDALAYHGGVSTLRSWRLVRQAHREFLRSLLGPACRRWILFGWLGITTLVLVCCSSTTGIEDNEIEPVFELPSDWHEDELTGETFDEGWCADFGDTALGELIDTVLEQNLDIHIAATRVAQARAVLRQHRAGRHPQLGLEALTEGERGRDGWEQEYELSARASYEVDLWGRVRSAISAAETDALAIEADLVALKMALAAETAELYFELARSRSEARVIQEQIAAAETFLELTKVRHSQGMASAIDIVQQEQQIEELHEVQRGAELDETLTLNALAILAGRPPGSIEVPAAQRLPEQLPPIADFLPAQLLERRPDVMAARFRVAAADDRVDAALAERLPQLHLSASLSTQAMNIGELFDFLFVGVAGSIFQSLWDGGRRQGEIDEQVAIKERQLFEFSSVLLDAIREVEDTLARGQALYEMLLYQRRQLDSAEEALELARVQYRAGILDYLRVLTALQSVQQLQRAELESSRLLLSQRVQLCRVAGGHWPDSGTEEEFQ